MPTSFDRHHIHLFMLERRMGSRGTCFTSHGRVTSVNRGIYLGIHCECEVERVIVINTSRSLFLFCLKSIKINSIYCYIIVNQCTLKGILSSLPSGTNILSMHIQLKNNTYFGRKRHTS